MLLCAPATVGGPLAHPVPSHTHPRTLHDLRPASYETSACASEGVVAKGVHFSSAAGGATSAGRHGQRKAQKAAQLLGAEAHSQPSTGLWARLRPEKGAGGKGQGRQQRAFAKVRGSNTRCTALT